MCMWTQTINQQGKFDLQNYIFTRFYMFEPFLTCVSVCFFFCCDGKMKFLCVILHDDLLMTSNWIMLIVMW